ncbi:MAG: hypothetical protein KAI66_19860 [Lentisphaeria bacterium]|nr:hypothetical protein [Lentisphaeria bacterium]
MSNAKSRSLADRIVGASLIVGIAHVCLKFAGLIQAKMATQFLDTNVYEPVLVVAYTGVIGTLFLIGEEVIGPSFLPVFMREMDDRGEEAAWDFTNVLLTLQALVLLIAVGAIMLFPDFFINLFTDWSAAESPDRYALLRRSLVFLAPALFFLSIGSTTYMLLNGYKRFFLAAFGDASTKICLIICLAIGVGAFGMGVKAVLFGLLLGSAAKLLTHLAGMLKERRRFRPSFNVRNPAVKAMVLLMLPLLAGILFAKVRDNFNGIYSLSRYKGDPGLLMANDLGRKLFAAIQWLVPYALQIALFPFLCELVDKDNKAKLGEVLSTSCRHLLAVFVPGAILIGALATPVSAFIFLGGKADFHVVVTWAGLSTACYILVLPAAAMECVLMQGFFATRKVISVTLIGIASSLLSVGISIVFIVILEVEATKALMVVSLGFVGSRFLKSLALGLYLRRSVPMFPLKETAFFTARIAMVGLLVGLATLGAARGIGRLLPDGLARGTAIYRTATERSGTVTVAGAHELLAARLLPVTDAENKSERDETQKQFKKAIRNDDLEQIALHRAALAAFILPGTPLPDRQTAIEGIDIFETILKANTEAVKAVHRVRVLIKLVGSVLVGALAFLLASLLLRVREPFEMVFWTLQKVCGKLGPLRGVGEKAMALFGRLADVEVQKDGSP